MRIGRHAQAVTEFELVHNLDPDNETIVPQLAGALLALNRTREARRLLVEYAEVLRANLSLEITRTLCDLLLSAGLPGIATDFLEEAIVRFPGEITIMRRLAFARFDGGDARGGDRLSRKLARIDPTLSSVHENLVLSALNADRPRLAKLRLKRALAACPRDERLRRLRVLVVVWWIPGAFRRLHNATRTGG